MTATYLFATNEHSIFKMYKRYRNYTLNKMHLIQKNDPATSVVIATPSNTNLAMVLEDMRDSIWWNHEALFLMVNENFDNGCRMARLLLSTIRAYNILSAIYLCYGSNNNQLMLYPSNPYTSLAPAFWNKVNDDHFSNESWTLFQHPLLQSFETVCL